MTELRPWVWCLPFMEHGVLWALVYPENCHSRLSSPRWNT